MTNGVEMICSQTKSLLYLGLGNSDFISCYVLVMPS